MTIEIAEGVDVRLHLEIALRKAATLVAQGADPDGLFATISEQMASVLGLVSLALLVVDVNTQALVKVIVHGRWDELAATAGAGDIRVPVTVDGAVWGCLAGHWQAGEPVAVRTDTHLSEFAELVAISVVNSRRREAVRDLADSQDALRRVATLVAADADPQTVFATVAREAGRVLGVGAVSLIRYDRQAELFTKIFGTHGDRAAVPDGVSWPIQDCPEGELVLTTGRPGRIDDWSQLAGAVAARHREQGFGQAVAAPIILDGATWGHIAAFGEAGDVLAPDCETRLADFTQLMASALANAQARDELRALAAQQGAALRRVATLVAQRADQSRIFSAVAMEASRALRVQRVDVGRCHDDGSVTLLGSTGPQSLGPGQPLSAQGRYVTRVVMANARASRIDDWRDLVLADPAVADEEQFVSVVGAPIWVEGMFWGIIVVLADGRLAGDIETRLADFTHLVAGSIANVQARNDLIASRARIVAASDEARRRIERNLHDGIQQRVVSLGLSLRAVRTRFELSADVQSGLDDVGRDLQSVLEEIQIFSQGLHPALLSRSGLAPSLRALARRSSIPIDLDILGVRLPESVESAVYYVVSEALANATKHSQASEVRVSVSIEEGIVRASVLDDGIGGAVAGGGSGLIGLVDRVEALGGTLLLQSPIGAGTVVSIELPVDSVTTAAKLSA